MFAYSWKRVTCKFSPTWRQRACCPIVDRPHFCQFWLVSLFLCICSLLSYSRSHSLLVLHISLSPLTSFFLLPTSPSTVALTWSIPRHIHSYPHISDTIGSNKHHNNTPNKNAFLYLQLSSFFFSYSRRVTPLFPLILRCHSFCVRLCLSSISRNILFHTYP